MNGPLYDYDRWANFSKQELVCQHTRLENPNVKEFSELVDFIQDIRTLLGISIGVNSAYRHESHPIEARKINKGGKAGQHARAAIDIEVPTELCWKVIHIAMTGGAKGVGVKLHGTNSTRFIHIDFREGPARFWSYP